MSQGSTGAGVASGAPGAKSATEGARRAFDPTRAIPVTSAADRVTSSKSAAGPEPRRSSSARPHATRSSRHHKPSARKRHVGRPILAGALALGLGASGFAYAKATNLIGADAAAFVVGSGVVAQTDELARASTVDTTYRAAASVSRNERRTAIAATGLRTAKELEAKKKKEAAKQAELAREQAAKAERAKERQRAIDNAKDDPQAAARVLMADHGWTSDAQYNCLVNLWTGESDWRWFAENPSSGAYGIPQSLPARKMSQFGADYRTNPLTQIKWGLWYIEMSYGNPCNAWSTWQARSPHWY
ncbi:MAG: lytic transglycosylase domain-containing protein [Terrabacter sp.]|nr:lytic transglycosylase domain-containing protein [Terrabacter sp.]